MSKENIAAEKSAAPGVSSFVLHLIAMALMLMDHLWATVIPGQNWMTWVGRIGFPVFAFLIAEGYFHTSNFKKYVLRMLIFALISEIPFNLMSETLWIFPFHQNVLWTFLIALLCMKLIDKLRALCKIYIALPIAAVLAFVFAFSAQILMTDYGMYGVLMVLTFYVFRGREWYKRIAQLACLVYINVFFMAGLTVPVELFGISFDLPQQSMAVLGIIPIWLYSGKQGLRNNITKYSFYAFYPAHMLILGLINLFR